MIYKLYEKYKQVILYIIFGGLTTAVNVGVYIISYNVLGVSNIVSVVLAWILSVIFAFITNKFFVFGSNDSGTRGAIQEFGKFIFARLATGGVDLLIMYATVDVLKWDAVLMKILANVIVVILNYVVSKKMVFNKR